MRPLGVRRRFAAGAAWGHCNELFGSDRRCRRATGSRRRGVAHYGSEGRLRADAATLDLRLLFAATRAAGQLQAGAWRRMLELGIDALRARR